VTELHTRAAPDTGAVLAERRGGVLLLTLNRPDRLNAWTDGLETRYFDLEPGAVVDAAVAYAQDLAEHSSPASMSVIKRKVQHDLDASWASCLERRAPDFRGLGAADRKGGAS
jgi:enoyl-CoA hydratase/carnithine racemase